VSDSRGISRRRFVAGAAGGFAALSAGIPLIGCGGDKGDRGRGRVVVVGAGLAGLTTAWELARKGWEVTVVEARDRVGGRCRTFRRELDLGQVAEAGGEFIDASHKQLLGYAKRFGLKLDDLNAIEGRDQLSDAVYVESSLYDHDAIVDESLQSELDRFDEQLLRYARAIDMNDPARTGAGLDTRSAGDLLDELDLDPEARLIAEAGLRSEYTVEPEDLSLLFLVVLTAITKDLADADVERYRIRGGNDQLPDAFANELRDAIRVKSPAESVEERGSFVRLIAGGERIDADYCVLAAPLPALRGVDLKAELPHSVRNAIGTLQYGNVVKTALQYDRRFWVDDGWSGDALTDLPIQATWDATGSQSGDGGVLMTYSAGAGAGRFARPEPRARIGAAADQVAELFASDDEPTAAATMAWGRERYSGGSYSAWAPGQYTRFWPALRRPYGRVYFAGEHTDLYASYMEGAVRSGQRVASAIDARRA
jgi:monoamine oxidase